MTSQSVFTKFEDPMVQMVHTPVLRSQATTQTALSKGLQQNLVKVTPALHCSHQTPEFVPSILLEIAIILPSYCKKALTTQARTLLKY